MVALSNVIRGGLGRHKRVSHEAALCRHNAAVGGRLREAEPMLRYDDKVASDPRFERGKLGSKTKRRETCVKSR
jgi:hypothetical protein